MIDSTPPTSFKTGKKMLNVYSPKGKIIHFKCPGKKLSSQVQAASTCIRQILKSSPSSTLQENREKHWWNCNE